MITPEQLAWLVIIGASFAAGAVVMALYGHYRREAAEDCPIPGCARWWPREDEGRTAYRPPMDLPGGNFVVGEDRLLLFKVAPTGTEEPPTDITGAPWRDDITPEEASSPDVGLAFIRSLDPETPLIDQLRERAFARAEEAGRQRKPRTKADITDLLDFEGHPFSPAGHSCDEPLCPGFRRQR